MSGTTGRRVVLVAAVAENGVIGKDGDLPWRIPEDLRHFKETTTGDTLLMGRVTFDSIGKALPGRTTVVVTRQPGWTADGVLTAGSYEEAVELAADLPGDLVIAGGSQIYARAMAEATHQVLTEVHDSPAGDTHYPPFDRGEWRETRREDHDGFSWVWLERRASPTDSLSP